MRKGKDHGEEDDAKSNKKKMTTRYPGEVYASTGERCQYMQREKLAFAPSFDQNVIFQFLFVSGNIENITKPEIRGPNDRRAKFVFAPLVFKAIYFLVQHMDACCIPGPVDPSKGGGGLIAL